MKVTNDYHGLKATESWKFDDEEAFSSKMTPDPHGQFGPALMVEF